MKSGSAEERYLAGPSIHASRAIQFGHIPDCRRVAMGRVQAKPSLNPSIVGQLVVKSGSSTLSFECFRDLDVDWKLRVTAKGDQRCSDARERS